MADKKPIYVGSGKTVSGQYGTFRNVTLKLSELKDYIYEYQGQKLVNLTINDKKETDQFGKNVSVTINDYKPENKEAVSKGNDLPF